MEFSKSIQGLRAFAVLVVIAVHLDPRWLSGGFVGVDVFFVISGFLITGLLVKEYENTGSIKFSDFYRRRIRRLFPALLVTCQVSALVGFLIFSDERFTQLLDSMMAALFSVSNLYFWSQTGYFDAESLVKPLLHTWSLGVEEQFYLVWPLLLLCLFRFFNRRGVIVSLVILSLLSFFLNALFMTFDFGDQIGQRDGWLSGFLDGDSTAFYLMPFRVFEFGIGALLIYIRPKLVMVNAVVIELVSFAAIAGLILLVVNLTDVSVFPYYNALLVALTSALLILFADRSRTASFLLSNRLMVFVGGVSYSLYLVHWPLVVYYKSLFGEPSQLSLSLLIILIFVCGYMLNIFVENRFRRARDNELVVGIPSYIRRSAIIIVLAISVVGIFIIRNIDGRIPENRYALSNSEWRRIERKEYCAGSIANFPKSLFTCQNYRGANNTIVIWGDSHALHLVGGFSEAFPSSNIAVAYLNGCVSQSGFNGFVREYSSQKQTNECVERNKEFLKWARESKVKLTVYISNAKRGKAAEISAINNKHIDLLNEYGHAAFVLGDFIRPDMQLAQCRSVPKFVITDEMLQMRCKPNERTVEIEISYSEELAALSKNYIPVHTVQCVKFDCRFSDDFGRISFRDDHHLSSLGARYWVSKLKDEGLLK